jgi:hypothetical protein
MDSRYGATRLIERGRVGASGAPQAAQPMFRQTLLQQDLRSDFGRAAAPAHELDRLVQVGFALRDPLRERKGIPRLHEDVEPPALDLVALVLFSLEGRQLFHPA